jgi:glycosyltransferase involved in cell wall biosynthesis
VLTQDRGGPVDVTVALAAALAAEPGYEVRLFAPTPARGADAVAAVLAPMQVGGKASAAAIRAARRTIRAWQPDLVHAQDRRSGLVCARLGVPVVHTYHGVPDDVSQDWLTDRTATPPSRYTRTVLAADAAVARLVDTTVVVAPMLRDFLVERLHVPAGKVVHIDNGLVLPPAHPPTGPVRKLLFVGLLVPRKGVHLLLEAFAAALTQGLPHDMSLTVVGNGEQAAALAAQVHRLGLDERVAMLGFRDDVPALLATHDAFVLPSTMEQQPLVLVEAMGAGLPVLATDVGGVADLVGPGALVVAPHDVPALAAALLQLADLDGAAVGAAAADRARSRFTLQHCLAAHQDLYRRVMRS